MDHAKTTLAAELAEFASMFLAWHELRVADTSFDLGLRVFGVWGVRAQGA